MLLNLSKEKALDYWDVIKQSILESLPENEKIDTNILLNLVLSKKMDCWLIYEKENEVKKALGILTTIFLYDSIFDSKTMLIYSLYGLTDFITSFDVWENNLSELKRYAKSQNCNNIIAYTENNSVIKNVKKLNGRVKSFIQFNI